jgi:competence protein ComEC
MGAVVERFRPRELWTTRDAASYEAVARVMEGATKDGTLVRIVDASTPPLKILDANVEILGPPAGDSSLRENDASLVMRITKGDASALMGGDIQSAGESALLSSGRTLRSEILKVAHQGSRASTGKEFLETVRPRFAVIMVGERNPYHLPNAETILRLEGAGARVLRTDRDGTITIRTGDGGIDINCFPRECR